MNGIGGSIGYFLGVANMVSRTWDIEKKVMDAMKKERLSVTPMGAMDLSLGMAGTASQSYKVGSKDADKFEKAIKAKGLKCTRKGGDQFVVWESRGVRGNMRKDIFELKGKPFTFDEAGKDYFIQLSKKRGYSPVVQALSSFESRMRKASPHLSERAREYRKALQEARLDDYDFPYRTLINEFVRRARARRESVIRSVAGKGRVVQEGSAFLHSRKGHILAEVGRGLLRGKQDQLLEKMAVAEVALSELLGIVFRHPYMEAKAKMGLGRNITEVISLTHGITEKVLGKGKVSTASLLRCGNELKQVFNLFEAGDITDVISPKTISLHMDTLEKVLAKIWEGNTKALEVLDSARVKMLDGTEMTSEEQKGLEDASSAITNRLSTMDEQEVEGQLGVAKGEIIQSLSWLGEFLKV